MVTFSYALAMVESDLTVIDAKLDEIIGCLVKGQPKSWQPSQDWEIGPLVGAAATETITGNNFEELYDKVQNLYIHKWWGDGLPCGAATKDRIDWLMTGVDHDPDDIVGADLDHPGEIPSSNRVLTYGLLANAMAMAGGRPEYMCVAEAICKCYIDAHSSRLASSMSASPFNIINGPITDEIRLGNGFHLYGPDPKRPAGRVLSRATWFVYQNVGNMLVGKGTIGQYGDQRPGRTFAENETGLPAGWKTYAEEYYGRPAGTNSASHCLLGMGNFVQHTMRGGGDDPLDTELSENLDRIAEKGLGIAMSRARIPEDGAGRGMAIWNGHVCRFYANSGWTKDDVLTELASRFWYALEDVIRRSAPMRAFEDAGIDINSIDPLTHIATMTDPSNIHFVCAGGDHTSQSRWVTGFSGMRNFEIEKPSNWSQLIAQAEDDLGPMPPKGEGGVDL
jgi:hypothetical protein